MAMIDRIEELRRTGTTAGLHDKEVNELCDIALAAASGRDAVIEECARVCDELPKGWAVGQVMGARSCAAAIRALSRAEAEGKEGK